MSRPVTIAHSHRAGPALSALAEADPALAALSLWCVHRDGAATRTAGSTITYGADFEACPLHEQIGLAAHHVLHVALRHSARMSALQARLGGAFQPEVYQLAADALINEALLLADHALPRPAVTATGLLKAARGEDIAPEAALSQWDVDRLYFALMQGDGGDRDTAKAARAYAARQGFAGDVDPEKGPQGTEEGPLPAKDAAQDAVRWRQHLSRAMAAGRSAGRGLGRIGHLLGDIPAPRTPWERVLRRLLTAAVTKAPQISPHRPARRWIAGVAEAERTGAPIPGFEPGTRPLTDVPRIAIAMDASGSIDDARLGLFWSEVTGIARRMRAELHLMIFDEEIRHRIRLDASETRPKPPQMPRGGGTAFIPVINAAVQMRASALVILTDLEGDPGPPPRGLPVIWALPDAGGAQAPYGRLIDLSA